MQKGSETKTITFKYDLFGRRIEKKVVGTASSTSSTFTGEDSGGGESKTYTYFYDNEDIIVEYLTKTDDGRTKTTATHYVHGPGIDAPLAIEQKGEVYYYHSDGLGSITTITDAKQKTVESYTYDSYGTFKRKGDKVKSRYTYTAREWDEELGLYYYRARYYDPKAGRFITRDPIGFKGGLNLYLYADQNPINRTDPMGLCSSGQIDAEKVFFRNGYNDWFYTANTYSWGPISNIMHNFDPSRPVCFDYAESLLNYLNAHVRASCCKASMDIQRPRSISVHGRVKVECIDDCGEKTTIYFDPWRRLW